MLHSGSHGRRLLPPSIIKRPLIRWQFYHFSRFLLPFDRFLKAFPVHHIPIHHHLQKHDLRQIEMEKGLLWVLVCPLSGGHIKEAVLRAASIAYGSKEQVVTQDLLIRSAQLEYKKLGKLAPQINQLDADRYL